MSDVVKALAFLVLGIASGQLLFKLAGIIDDFREMKRRVVSLSEDLRHHRLDTESYTRMVDRRFERVELAIKPKKKRTK